MPVLQQVRRKFTATFPLEVQKLVAQHLDIPLEEVYGVVYLLLPVSL